MSSETLINQSVKVWVFFDWDNDRGQNVIQPIAMNWQRRLVKFEKLVLITSRRNGQEKILSLICASDSANYELEYNSQLYSWTLKRIMSKE